MNLLSRTYQKILTFFFDEDRIKGDRYEILSTEKLLITLFAIFLFLVFYTIYFFIITPSDWIKHGTNIVGSIAILVSIILLKKSFSKTYAVLILNLICFCFTFISLIHSGGIYSIDLEWYLLCAVCSFLFVSIELGIIVSGLNIGLVFCLYYLELIHFKDFKSDSIKSNGLHEFFTFTFLQIVYGTVLYFFIKILIKTQRELDEITHQRIEDLNELVEKRTQENLSLRNDIARDFHDVMGNKLASIASLSEMLMLKGSVSEEEIKNEISRINALSKEVYDGTKDFVWAINIPKNNISHLYSYISELAERIFQNSEIDFVSYPVANELQQTELSPTWVSQFVMIIREAMTNTLQHSKAKNVVFEVKEEKGSIFFIWMDNGKGFNMNEISRINGLNNMKVRAQKIGVTLEIDSRVNQYTYVLLSYPVAITKR